MLTQLLSDLNLSPLVYLVLILALTLMVISWMQSPRNLPPCPVRPYPIVGHLPMMRVGAREKMKEWREKVGDIFSLYVGGGLTVVINDYETMKETLVKQADIFSDRPDVFFNKVVEDNDKGIIGASGHLWKEQRTVSLSILRNFGMGKNSLAEKINEEVSAYLDELASFKGEPREVRTLTNTSVSNVICSIIVGKRFKYDDPYFVRFMHLFNELLTLASGVSILTPFPWLRCLPGDFFGAKKIIKINEEMTHHFSDPFIQKTSEELNENDVDNFIAAYLLEIKKKEEHGEDTALCRRYLRIVINNLFIAGSETTSTTMMWFMLYMLHYPDIQKKVYDEIDDVVGTERAPTLHDKTKLNYLNATIMETQRLASIAPFGLVHLCSAEVNVRGYTIPAGTTIIPCLDSVLRDKKTWGDPMNFRPERFLDDKGHLLSPEQFIPFSLGRRVCLGEALATMELFIYLSALIQRFELLPAVPGSLPPQDYLFGATCPPVGYELRFKERRST